MNLNFGHAVKTCKNVITANSPVLLLGTAIAGVVGTGVLAAKGGYKARGIIDNFEETEVREATTQEKIQLTWLCYAAPVLTGASAIASATGVHYIHTKRFAAMAGFYAVTANKLDDYQEKAEEMLGAKKSQALNDAVTQKSLDRNGPKNEFHDVVILEGGTELARCEFSERYAMASVPIIERAVAEGNLAIKENGHCSLNDFHAYLGLSPSILGDNVGWGGEDRINVRFSNGDLAPDGRPCISFAFRNQPQEGYTRK